MKKRTLPRLLLGAVVFFALPAAADAPTNPPQYERFDQDSVTIKDAFTKLEWDRSSVIKNVTYDLADCGLVASLSNAGRLPTVKELLTILDEEPHVEYEFGVNVTKMIDQLAFGDATPVDLPYWTSTPAPNGMMWTLSFATGAMTAMPKTAHAHARCVL